jgi:hypothetical protein
VHSWQRKIQSSQQSSQQFQQSMQQSQISSIVHVKNGSYLRSGWGFPKRIMRWSQDQEISPSKWVRQQVLGRLIELQYFIIEIY